MTLLGRAPSVGRWSGDETSPGPARGMLVLKTKTATTTGGVAVAVALAAALAVGAAACATGGDSSRPAVAPGSSAGGRGDRVGQPAPEIVVERLNGQRLPLSSLRGKVVLLDVWASWCIPCKKELPMLDAIARRLGSRGVEVVAVSIDQQRANVVKFLETQGDWALTVAHDPNGVIADALQPEKMPTSYVIDREGTIRYVNGGFEPADAPVLERRLAELAGDGAHAGRRARDGDGHGTARGGPRAAGRGRQ